MTDNALSSMYSRKGLQALEQSLELHRGLVWADPVTNTIAVKRITEVEEVESSETVQQVNT